MVKLGTLSRLSIALSALSVFMAHFQPLNRALPIHLGIISTERCCKLGINYDFDVGGDDFIIVVIIYISRGRMMNWKSVKWIKN